VDLIEPYLKILKANGGRITPIRLAILKTFLRRPEHLLSAQEVLKQLKVLKPSPKTCDLVTVYRALEGFEKSGILASTDLGDGVKRFELAHENHHHHHIICNDCKSIQVIDECVVKPIESIIAKLGYTKISHRLEFSGVCTGCSK